jgi:predicted nucleic acid-binding protein
VAEIVEIDKKNVASQSSILKDPDDNVIVELVGKADYIISGDKDLLDLMVFEKTKIVSVDQLLEILS